MLELWLVVVGSVVHGIYAWTGSNMIVGLFVPVNESVWEHFKLGYAALLLWHLLPERVWPRKAVYEPLVTALGIVVINVVVILVFLLVRPMVHGFSAKLTVDIGSYVLGSIVAGQLIRRWKPTFTQRRFVGVMMWVLIGSIFAALTLWPPQVPLFIQGGMGS